MDLESGFSLEEFRVEPRNGRLATQVGHVVELEPKVMDLLCLLARHAGETLSREQIAEALWDGRIVNDDALARTVFKLRKALGDEAREPRFIATVPKRGYRLLVSPEQIARDEPAGLQDKRFLWAGAGIAGLVFFVSIIWGLMNDAPDPDTLELAQLVERADDAYAQISESENASAMRLYERVIAADPANAPAHAGLANTLTQVVLRWSPGTWPEIGVNSRVQTALANGRTQTPQAQQLLERALVHARRSVEIDPGYALGYRALGLALSASGAIEEAIEAYNRAVTIDPDAWEALINLSDLAEYQGEADLSLSYIEQGFEAMSRVYEDQAVRIRPWYSITGNSIARDHLARGDQASGEMWYRRVLHWDPLNAEALTGLAALLRARGDMVSARETCAVLADELDRTACLEG